MRSVSPIGAHAAVVRASDNAIIEREPVGGVSAAAGTVADPFGLICAALIFDLGPETPEKRGMMAL